MDLESEEVLVSAARKVVKNSFNLHPYNVEAKLKSESLVQVDCSKLALLPAGTSSELYEGVISEVQGQRYCVQLKSIRKGFDFVFRVKLVD